MANAVEKYMETAAPERLSELRETLTGKSARPAEAQDWPEQPSVQNAMEPDGIACVADATKEGNRERRGKYGHGRQKRIKRRGNRKPREKRPPKRPHFLLPTRCRFPIFKSISRDLWRCPFEFLVANIAQAVVKRGRIRFKPQKL